MRVLAIGAHPDDLEILCGGTLARFVREGHEVTMCHASVGDRGSFDRDAPLVEIRAREAQRAGEIAGAAVTTLGLSDGEVLASDPEQRRAVIDLVRSTQPQLIITHHPGDYMADHNEISRLVFDCSFLASLPCFETRVQQHAAVTPLYYMETLMGLQFTPTEYVDISAVIDVKAEMVSAHESQLTWLAEHDGADILEQVTATARYRGLQCGVRYAESFARCDTWLRGTTARLLP